MSEIVDKALALMLRHAANEASDYGDVRPATGFGPAVMRFDKESKTFGSTPLRTKLSDLAKQVSLTGPRPHRRARHVLVPVCVGLGGAANIVSRSCASLSSFMKQVGGLGRIEP